MIDYLHKAAWFLGLALIQVLILNHIHIAGYATPFLYIYLILTFDSNVSRNTLMLWGFCLGLTVDVFSDTPGMNAAACVLLAFLRPILLRLFTPRNTLENDAPSLRLMGVAPFLKYIIAGTLLHHLLLFSLEYFSTAHPLMLLVRMISSTALTVACIMAVEGIRKR